VTAVFTHPITRFIARRLLYSLVVLFGVLVVAFALVHLVPGDPVRIALGTRYTPEAYNALRSASGLDRPLVEQFFGYIGSALTGDLGVSFRNGDPVTVTLLERLPATVSLGLVGILIALLIALPAGIWSALREGRVSDAIVRITSQFGCPFPISGWESCSLRCSPARSVGCLRRATVRCSTTRRAGCVTSYCLA
jgi:peptide/nickel transport system permease protein